MNSALVVLFNQDYSTNIPKLERIYAQRFSHLVYLVPDHWSRLHRAYTGSRIPVGAVVALDRMVHVVRRLLGRRNPHELDEKARRRLGSRFRRVVGHQFFFYDFVCQAASYLLSLDVDWFWVVGDDAMLNPAFDETSLPDAVEMRPDTEAVMCRPVIGSDAWLARIAGSVPEARQRLADALGVGFAQGGRDGIRPEKGAEANTDIAVACADFFGVSRRTLSAIVPVWRKCLGQRLYVELAMPNSVLANTGNAAFVDNYFWTRVGNAGESVKLIDKLRDDPQIVFVHPVKLSAVDAETLGRLEARRAVSPGADNDAPGAWPTASAPMQ